MASLPAGTVPFELIALFTVIALVMIIISIATRYVTSRYSPVFAFSAGILMLFMFVSTTGVLLGYIANSSSTVGGVTTQKADPLIYDFQAEPIRVYFAFISAIFITIGAIEFRLND